MRRPNGGRIAAPNLTVVRNGGIKIQSSGVIDTNQLTTLTEGYIEASGESPDLSSLSTIDGSGLTARLGATIELPSVTTYADEDSLSHGHHDGVLATGFGNVIKFLALTSLNGATFINVNVSIRAETGGLVNMPPLTTIETGNTIIEVVGSQSHINLGSLSSYSKSSCGESYIDVQSNAKLTLHPETTPLTDVGITLASNATVEVGELILDGESTLESTGTFNGDVSNSSLLGNGSLIDTFTINGNYVQSETGTLEVDIRDTNPTVGYDRYTINGNAEIAGTVMLRFTNGFAPSVGDQYEIVTAETITGSFSSVTTENLDPALEIQLTVDADNITAEIVSTD